jgi:hypothetical protein
MPELMDSDDLYGIFGHNATATYLRYNRSMAGVDMFDRLVCRIFVLSPVSVCKSLHSHDHHQYVSIIYLKDEAIADSKLWSGKTELE